ncbi:unnamed protein product [Calypogeia fissa]
MAYHSATHSATPIRAVNGIAMVLVICFLLATPSTLFVLAKPKAMTFYVHERRAPPASLILVAPTTGPLTKVKWGSVLVIDNEVRETNSTDSTYLGRQLGSVVVGSDGATFYASFTYLLNTTAYAGSLTLAGIVQSGKMVVTGGTDSFNLARGVASVQTLSNTPTAAIYEYTLRLKY